MQYFTLRPRPSYSRHGDEQDIGHIGHRARETKRQQCSFGVVEPQDQVESEPLIRFDKPRTKHHSRGGEKAFRSVTRRRHHWSQGPRRPHRGGNTPLSAALQPEASLNRHGPCGFLQTGRTREPHPSPTPSATQPPRPFLQHAYVLTAATMGKPATYQ